MAELPSSDPDLRRILAAFDDAAKFFRNGALFIGLVGAFALVVGAARGIWWLAGFSAVFFGALVWLMIWSERKSKDPERSPVLRAVVHEPHTVAKVTHGTASSSSGAFKTHWLHLRTAAGAKRGIKVLPEQIVPLAQALARRCPVADIVVPGFERRVVQGKIID